MDIRLNDVLEMKKTHPCGRSGGRYCAPAWISACAAWAAAWRR
ncbi:MAG: DUF951 family protein [Oscillospiraceae bacterium]